MVDVTSRTASNPESEKVSFTESAPEQNDADDGGDEHSRDGAHDVAECK
jgi:hypothetical protein